MNTLIPGAPLRSLSPTTNEYQRAQGESRAAKPARAARFTLDAPEHSGTIPGARGDILTPGVALTSNLAVIFTLNQHSGNLPAPVYVSWRACAGSRTTRGRNSSCDNDLLRVAFRAIRRRRPPEVYFTFAAQYPARTSPCQRFAFALANNNA